MARAFSITVNSKYDLRPIKKYGDVVYLYTDMQHPSINNPQRMIDDCIERLENFSFDPEKDFIIMTGAVANVSLFIAAAFIQYGKIKLLMYDPRTNKYYEREINEPEDDEPRSVSTAVAGVQQASTKSDSGISGA